MEVALGRFPQIQISPHNTVSILVFVEVALGLGRNYRPVTFHLSVSILVFVEVALGPSGRQHHPLYGTVSILVFVEVALGQGIFFALFGVSQC